MYKFLLLFLLLMLSVQSYPAEILKVGVTANQTPIYSISGEIKTGDDLVFNKLVIESPVAIIRLDSPGGSLKAALNIGKTIYIKEFRTQAVGDVCASACALIWLAGQTKEMGSHTIIGFHQASKENDNKKEIPDLVVNGLIGGYLARIGISQRGILEFLKSPPEDMTILTPDLANKLGISVIVNNENINAAKIYNDALKKIMSGQEKLIKDGFAEYIISANDGFAGAQNNLGDLYEKGEIVPKNDIYAIYWYTRAAERGEPTAYLSLAGILSKSNDELVKVEALKFAILAIDHLADDSNKESAKSIKKRLENDLPKKEIETAEFYAMNWNPLFQERILLRDKLK
jgi:hypothetical protein